MSVNLQIT